MGRKYSVIFDNVAVTTTQDLITILGASNKQVLVKRVMVGATDTSLVTAQGLQIRCRHLPATVTTGSGGSAPTPRKMDQGDPAASFTARANDTTQSSTNGTAVTLFAKGIHIYAGMDHTFTEPPAVGSGQAFTFELLSGSVAGTVHLSATVDVEEIGL